jgi:molybdate transport system substrate-binding protein
MLAVVIASTAVEAAEIRLMSSIGIKRAMEALLPPFEQSTGQKVIAIYGLSVDVKAQIENGQVFDVLISTPARVDGEIKQGRAVGPRIELARAGCGLAVGLDAPKPDISTDETLKEFLLSVKTISSSDPARGGFSANYFAKLAAALGISDAVNSKTTFVESGESATLVAAGKSELGVGVMSELVPVKGVQVLPLKADDPKSFVSFSAAIGASPTDSTAVNAFLAFIQSPLAKKTFEAQGMTTR